MLNVYMPTNYGDSESLESYIDCLSKLHAIMVDVDAVHVIIAGDFNCSYGSRFFGEFACFATDHGLMLTDLDRLHNVFTYISDDGTKMSWVDYVLSTGAVDKLVDSVSVLDDVIVSDHKPLSLSIRCRPTCTLSSSGCTADAPTQSDTTCLPVWQSCDDATCLAYTQYVHSLLQRVRIPPDLLLADSIPCDFSLYVIDQYYVDTVSCVKAAVSDVIPKRKCTNSSFNIPGWNTYVKEKHEFAREAYTAWAQAGRPKFGTLFDNMNRNRAIFKLALRYCRNHIEEMKADACAESLLNKDVRKFWDSVYKISNAKASAHVNSIGGVTGSVDVTNMWKDYFEKLYNSKQNSEFRTRFI